MHFLDLIRKKRNGETLTEDEIRFFVQGVTEDTLPDYQVSAFLMAVYFSSLDAKETAVLTMEMAHSGRMLDFSDLPQTVDKHSTGGIGDTTTLILAPLIASLGVPVVKMSGRGLGFTGGTIDKLEAIPGFRTALTEEEAHTFVKRSGIVLMGQTDTLTPADKKLYALRDVTATVESLPLIAASIMSKKIAAGASNIVLDVKYGSGALMKCPEDARELARRMVEIGKSVGRGVTAIISGMEQPLGQAIGNSIEVIEAIEVLKGHIKGDLRELSLILGAHMLRLCGRVKTEEEGIKRLDDQIENGEGLAMLCTLIEQQGGDIRVLEDYSLFPSAVYTLRLTSEENGWLVATDAEKIGLAAQETGAGRTEKGQPLQLGSGIMLHKRLGDTVQIGDCLADVYSDTMQQCEAATALLKEALTLGTVPPVHVPLVLDKIE